MARLLGGSLEWLAGLTLHRGEAPSPDERFDPRAFEEERLAHGVPLESVRAILGVDIGRYRRFVNGRFEPTLDEVISLQQLLKVDEAFPSTPS